MNEHLKWNEVQGKSQQEAKVRCGVTVRGGSIGEWSGVVSAYDDSVLGAILPRLLPNLGLRNSKIRVTYAEALCIRGSDIVRGSDMR
jgi:hypothetical protein